MKNKAKPKSKKKSAMKKHPRVTVHASKEWINSPDFEERVERIVYRIIRNKALFG